MPVFRGFIAIDIMPTPKILAFENEITKTGADVKLVELENIHITIKFLGDTDQKFIDPIEQIIKESAKEIKPFSITLKGTGVFPNQNYIKIIWIGIMDAAPIETLVYTIDTSLVSIGFKKDQRVFSPHLTIGRVKTAKNKEKLLKVIEDNNNIEFAVQEVKSIVLKKSELTSQGPIYTTLREVRL